MAWVHAVIDAPPERRSTLAAFWSGVLDWELGAPWVGHPELASFTPPQGDPYLHLQMVHAPPRVHIDIESADHDTFVIMAIALGAGFAHESDRWRTLWSPGGLPFCVLGITEHQPPAPTTWPDGHQSRAVQVCIDSPRAAYEAEVVFWRTLLPGRWVDSPAQEFAGKWHDDEGSPLQLLFQRLDEAHGPVRAHLDHGTDDLHAEIARLRQLGAGDIGAGRGWHALRDPSGLPFCVTGNSPTQTRFRDLG